MGRVVLVLALVLAAAPARGWVFHDESFGDFRLVCWSSAEGSKDAQCSLSAPRQSLGTVTENLLHVQEFAPDAFQVAIEMRGDPQPYAPVWLKAGTFPAHEAPVTGEWGRWPGAESSRIVGEMRAADRLVFRVRIAPNGRPQETGFSLARFRDALDAYRAAIRRHRILAPSR